MISLPSTSLSSNSEGSLSSKSFWLEFSTSEIEIEIEMN